MFEARNRANALCLIFALSLGAALRFYGLNRFGLDLDEMTTGAWARSPDWGHLMGLLWNKYEGNAAGYPIFIYGWGQFSLSETWLRIPSALAGTASIGIFFWASLFRFGRFAAAAGSLLVCLGSIFLFQSQNARPYSLFGLCALLALASHWALVQKKRGALPAYIVSASLALYLHHFAFLYLSLLWLDLLLQIRSKLVFRTALWAIAGPLLLYLPHVPLLWHQWQNGPRWIPPLEPHTLWLTLKSMLWMHHEIATLGLASLVIWGAFIAAKKRDFLLLAWTTAPFLVGGIISLLFRDVFVDRYFFPSAFGFFFLATYALNDLSKRKGLMVFCGILLAFSFLGIRHHYSIPKLTSFREGAEFVDKNQASCSQLVLVDPRLIERWGYYLKAPLIVQGWDRFPEPPFWILQAGYPAPNSVMQVAQSGSTQWSGLGSIASCYRIPLKKP